nr:pyridoxamine 5'-phosphate oxidase family protein [Microbacterium bovistercoris]
MAEGEEVSRGASGSGAAVRIEELPSDECWRLLGQASLARLAFVDADGDPEIYPVNFRTDRGVILIRSADDGKVRSIAAHPRVAMEVDGGALRVRWSVIVHATAEVSATDAAGQPPTPPDALSWFPGEKALVIRLMVRSITGRRFLVPAGVRLPGASSE